MNEGHLLYYLPQRIFHFLISQTVDQGVQHGGYKVIQDLNSCIKPGVRGGLQVDENHWHKGEEDGSEVGAAGGEGTLLAFGRLDLKNGANDAAVGGEDEKEAAEGHETHTDEPHHLQGRGVCTSQLQHHWDITEVIVHLIGATVGQLAGECSQKGGLNAPKKRGAHGQDGTRSVTHDYCVAQRVAYGNKAVIGHYRVQETFGTTQEVVEEELGHAACVGDGSAVP